jgi:hypothetical protein
LKANDPNTKKQTMLFLINTFPISSSLPTSSFPIILCHGLLVHICNQTALRKILAGCSAHLQESSGGAEESKDRAELEPWLESTLAVVEWRSAGWWSGADTSAVAAATTWSSDGTNGTWARSWRRGSGNRGSGGRGGYCWGGNNGG